MNEHITPGLAALMRDAQTRFADDGAQAPTEVITAARRRRRRSGALLGASSVAVLAALTLAGIGVSGGASPTPSLSPLPSASPPEDLSVPLASATIPLEGGPAYEGVSALQRCGAPAPVPTGMVDHFTLKFDEWSPVVSYNDTAPPGEGISANASIRYNSSEPVAVAQTPIVTLLVKDDVVQGYLWPDYGSLKYWTYSDEQPYYGGGGMLPGGYFCPEVASSSLDGPQPGSLEAGTYQLIPVVRLWANQESAALKYLYTNGIEVIELEPSGSPLDLRPGSWDCEQFATYGQSTRSCLGDVTGSAIVNMEAGTVTLPYKPSELTRELDVTVVGAPITITVDEDFLPEHSRFIDPIELKASDPIACGTVFDYAAHDAMVQIRGSLPTTPDGGRASMSATFLPFDKRKAALTLGDNVKIWLVGDIGVGYEYFEDHPGNRVVVGVADVAVVGPARIKLDRYAGPTPVELALTQVRMCPDMQDTSPVSMVFLDSTMTVTFDDGASMGPTHLLTPIHGAE